MRVIRRIANAGRTVICTIHQPSAELFFMFDRLLLLKAGGECVFFGPLGDQVTSFGDASFHVRLSCHNVCSRLTTGTCDVAWNCRVPKL